MASNSRNESRKTQAIRNSLLGTVAALSVMVVGTQGREAWHEWQRLDTLTTARSADEGANQFAAGLFEVLLERVATNNALQAPDPAGPEVLQTIQRHRAAVQRNFDPGLAVLAAQEFPGRDQLLRNLRTALERADDFRRRADEALRLPRDRRDEALRRDFIPTITASVEAALAVWFSASHVLASADPTLARLAMVKELGWRMRDWAGRERSSVASSIAAQQPVSAERIAANAGVRMRVDLLWEQFGILAPANDPATHPSLRAAVEGARREYYGNFRTLVDTTVRAGAEGQGGRYAMSAERFVEITTPQIGALLNVMFAAGEASQARAAALVSESRTGLFTALGLLALGLLVAAGAAWLVVRRVTRPLGELTAATSSLAAGNLDRAVPGTERADEIGEVSRALEALREGSLRARELEATAAAQRAAQEKRQAEVAQHTEQFGVSIAGVMSALVTSADEMRKAADDMARAVEEANNGASATVAGSDENARNLSAVASAAEEMTASVGEISRQVAQAAQLAQDAVQKAQDTDSTVRSLSEAASQIGDVVRLISDIAGQTNLLALNATIEAARAGDAGKGFAVVASEVKQLAAQTAKATEQISLQIGAIQTSTDGAVNAVREVGEAIARMDEVAAAIAAAIEEQGAATREIASSVQSVAAQNDMAASSMRDVTRVVGDAGEVAKSVLGAADHVTKVSTSLRGTVDQFLSAVGTAGQEERRRA